VKVRTFEVELIPVQVNGFGYPQAMSSHYQDQRCVSLSVPAGLGGFD
jgi:hypothetical protein